MTGPVNKDYRNLRMSLVTVSYEALNPGSALVDVINVIWMELVSEYTGSGIDWPHSRNGLRPSSDATFVIIRLAPPKFGPEQSVFWPFSKVKFKKDNLTRPLGTVIVQTHLLWIKVVWKVGACDKSTWWPADGNSSSTTGYNIQFEKKKKFNEWSTSP